MFLPINILLERGSVSAEIRDLLKELHPKFNSWYGFYEQHLLGISIPCTFSYRERTSILTEQSNLDDYPRGVNVYDRAEIHLDLQS